MIQKRYNKIVKKHTPKEDRLKNAAVAFLVGGFMGIIGEGLVELYGYAFNISSSEASIYMIITLIFFGCLFTCFGWFDTVVNFAKCGLIVPITGFAHAMQSAALEYKGEGFVTGIGANMFKLTGSVIVFGVVSAYTFGLIRLIVMGG